MRTFSLLVLFACLAFFTVSGVAENKYVGTKTCSMCHKTEKSGNQFAVWQKSKHAEAYKTLMTAKANDIAKAKGSKKPAVETPECLGCHTVTAPAAQLDKTFDVKDGVQCENCHGAGSSYKTMTTMKEHAKAVAAGLAELKDDASKEKLCVTCHNDKSPTHKAFKLKEMWDMIKHPKKS
jgi:hypothetical protein